MKRKIWRVEKEQENMRKWDIGVLFIFYMSLSGVVRLRVYMLERMGCIVGVVDGKILHVY